MAAFVNTSSCSQHLESTFEPIVVIVIVNIRPLLSHNFVASFLPLDQPLGPSVSQLHFRLLQISYRGCEGL